MILWKDPKTDRFRTLKESHPATSSVAFSFDYDWDTISFALSLSLEITVPRLSNQWQENCWPKLLPLLYKWSFKITWFPFKSGSMRPRCFQFELCKNYFVIFATEPGLFSMSLRALVFSLCWGHLREMGSLVGNCTLVCFFFFLFKIRAFQGKERLVWITPYCLEFQYSFKKHLRSAGCEPSTEVTYVFICPRIHAFWGRHLTY